VSVRLVPRLTGLVLIACVVLPSAPASAQGGRPGGRDNVAFDFMNLLSQQGLHDINHERRNAYGQLTAITSFNASKPLRLTDGAQRLAVVSDQAFADVGAALTFGRWRWYFNLDFPLAISGQSGTLGGLSFAAPSVTLGSHPDTLTDARLGVDVRILGDPAARFRLGVGAQLYLANGVRADYTSDGTVRGMLRVLFAGDLRRLTWAGQLGVHVRTLDDATIPGGPRGSELLFGVAGGARWLVGRRRSWALIAGPEVFGATPFLDRRSTSLEGLVSARLESASTGWPRLRVKLGAGGGLSQHLGAPEWRVVLGVEAIHHLSRPSRSGDNR
jgi:hypothetical protein